MSLDVYLHNPTSCPHCHKPIASNDRAYQANITHNLNTMAEAAGIYRAMWRPEEIDITTARQLIPLLTEGLAKLKADPEAFRVHNPENGWGSYESLVRFVTNYLEACENYPDAVVSICR